MGFNNRYGITEFSNHPTQRVSLSLDDHGEGVAPVMLTVPDINHHEHDHIWLSRKNLNDFLVFLTTKGQSRFENHHYVLVINKYSLADKTVEMEVFQKSRQEGPKFQYTLTLPMQALSEMSDWIKEYEKRTPAELAEQFKKDEQGR